MLEYNVWNPLLQSIISNFSFKKNIVIRRKVATHPMPNLSGKNNLATLYVKDQLRLKFTVGILVDQLQAEGVVEKGVASAAVTGLSKPPLTYPETIQRQRWTSELRTLDGGKLWIRHSLILNT